MTSSTALVKRVTTFQTDMAVLRALPTLGVHFDTQSTEAESAEAVNLHHYLRVMQQIAIGTYNAVYHVMLRDTGKECVWRTPLFSTRLVDSQRSDYYAVCCSQLVQSDIFPHFPLVINSFVKEQESKPCTLQEKADGDLLKFLKKATLRSRPSEVAAQSRRTFRQLCVQSLLTMYFVNTSLGLSHSDTRGDNLLIMDLTTPLTYKLLGSYVTLRVDMLVLLTDFDRTKPVAWQSNTSLNHYLRPYMRNSIHEALITTVYNKLLLDRMDSVEVLTQKARRHDIVIFLTTLLNRPAEYVGDVPAMLHDYGCADMPFLEFLRTYYADVCEFTREAPTDTPIYDLDVPRMMAHQEQILPYAQASDLGSFWA